VFSVSPAEILTIGVVALLVFGPKRLPEIARRAGRIVRDLRASADALKADLEEEYRDALEPLDEARRQMRAAATDDEPDPGPDEAPR